MFAAVVSIIEFLTIVGIVCGLFIQPVVNTIKICNNDKYPDAKTKFLLAAANAIPQAARGAVAGAVIGFGTPIMVPVKMVIMFYRYVEIINASS